MTRTASSALAPVADALARLTAGVRPVEPRAIAPASAIGLIAAQDATAPLDVPAYRAALRDGWATDAASVTGASPYAPIPLRRPPVWVEAGAPLPDDADVVLPPEAFAGGECVEDAPALDGVRGAGEEIAKGSLLVAAGDRLTPALCAGLAAAGVASIAVRRPRLRIVVTGAPAPARGDAVSAALAAMSAPLGAVTEIVTAPDAVEPIAAAIRADGADAVLVVGGTGDGRTDRSAQALAAAGELMLHGLALRPGETGGVGSAAGRPVILSPGRPEAAFAIAVTLLRPLLALLAGVSAPAPERATLRRKIASTIGLTEVIFVRREDGGAEPLGGADLPIARLMRADGAVLVNPDSEGYPERAEIEVTPL